MVVDCHKSAPSRYVLWCFEATSLFQKWLLSFIPDDSIYDKCEIRGWTLATRGGSTIDRPCTSRLTLLPAEALNSALNSDTPQPRPEPQKDRPLRLLMRKIVSISRVYVHPESPVAVMVNAGHVLITPLMLRSFE